MHRFEHTRAWIFDLDNTLYPAECNLFAQVDSRMAEFIGRYLGVPFAQARHLQKTYYRQFGTTLAGLMKVHNLEPEPFLDYVHDIDLAGLHPHPELAAVLTRLPGRRYIYTNGSRRHAERVAGKIGILDQFHGICDITECQFVPKPEREAFEAMIRLHGVTPSEAAMFEDMPHNLEAPAALGMTTILVKSDYMDHPVQLEMRKWTALPPYIHFETDNLAQFLEKVVLHGPRKPRARS